MSLYIVDLKGNENKKFKCKSLEIVFANAPEWVAPLLGILLIDGEERDVCIRQDEIIKGRGKGKFEYSVYVEDTPIEFVFTDGFFESPEQLMEKVFSIIKKKYLRKRK